MMHLAIHMEEEITSKENTIYYFKSKIYSARKEIQILEMFDQILKYDFFYELKFDPLMNDYQKAKVFYYLECTKFLCFEYEEKAYPVYISKSKKYKEKTDFSSYVHMKSNILSFIDRLEKDIESYKFPTYENSTVQQVYLIQNDFKNSPSGIFGYKPRPFHFFDIHYIKSTVEKYELTFYDNEEDIDGFLECFVVKSFFNTKNSEERLILIKSFCRMNCSDRKQRLLEMALEMKTDEEHKIF